MSDDAVRDLLKKGDGVLSKRNGVWTYPGCPTDNSGTNLRLPVEFVTDAQVQSALSGGTLAAAVMAPDGAVSSVRLASDEVAVINSGLAGTPEMGTELPPNSRVSHDAGSAPITPAQAEKQVADVVAAMQPKPAQPAPAPAPAKAGRG